MNIKKLLIGGIAAGIVYFLLGWLVYGIMLMDFFAANHALPEPHGVDRAAPILHFLFLGNVLLGVFLAFVFQKANVKGIAAGVTTGAAIGLLLTAGIDFTMYGLTTLANLKAVAADIAVAVVMYAIMGAVVGVVEEKMN